jgi:predicted transport protein
MTQPLRLNALEEVPYALGLIRQTLKRQLEGDS